MRVVTAAGPIDLGTTETTPTIGITDYSVRTTDDFGVTTVTPRGFSRTLTVKSLVPTDQVDALQQQLAAIRAQSAQWIADDRFAWLAVQGFYKDFSVELALQTVSYCSLTIEGLAETEATPDPGGDPAVTGSVSSLLLLQPVAITDVVLLVDSVPENDAAAWDGAISYPANARVIRTETHRVYQSTTAHNQGNTPETSPAVWLDLGPTNRWAMFDQALGTATTADGSIALRFAAGSAPALALLDVTGSTVRVQIDGTAYDTTQPVGLGALTFLDMPSGGGAVTVTIAGSGQVAVGTLIAGTLVSLGVTEASPTAGITDYSLKVADDFGTVTPVERAWSKNMAAKALIRTDAVDMVAGRIAAVRAVPSLWIGQAGLDALTVYGFWKDFSIEVAETTATLSLSIEGLSKAAKVEPLTIPFDNVTGDNRPAPSATRNVPRGEWNAVTIYAQGDIVTYQGSSYIAGQAVPAGTYPTNAVYWDILAEQGTSGIPGPAGANGQPTYFHIAYADNADGTQGLINDPSGKAYIGVYSDGNGSSSLNPSAYAWSRLTGRDGVDGTNGTPGPIGSDGRTSYVHFAYADSANGGTNFTTGAPGSRTYIGVYSDFTEPDSNDPAAYAWSLIKGVDGVPGAIGPAGQSFYTWVAYADSIDGTINFTTGVPSGRKVQGVSFNRTSPTKSTNPADYTWNLYGGPPGFGLVPALNVALAGNKISCISSSGWGSCGAYSSEGWASGAQLSVHCGEAPTNCYWMAGLNTDPSADNDYHSIDYAWFVDGNDTGTGAAHVRIFESGVGIVDCGPVGESDVLSIAYDNAVVRYFINGVLKRQTGAAAGLTLYFDTAMISGSLIVTGFVATGSRGTDGAPGIPGAPGANGQPSYVHVAYANSADGATDFIAGIANPGRSYIGIYTDTTAAGSGDYHAYNWSRLTGVNGLNGANGTPGPIGADGRQSYVHFAYADSINGSANFTTGDPGGRGFIGVYSDYALADSTNPGSYEWSLIKGADGATGGPGSPGANGANGIDGLSALNIHTVGAVSWDGHNLTCTSGAGNWTTNGAYSGNVIPGGVALSFQRPNWYGNEDAFFGISSSPTVAIDYPAVEFAWRMQQSGSSYIAEIWHAGSGLYSEGWNGGSNYSIRYDANTGVVTWYRNDTAIYTYNAGAGRSFGLEMTAGRNVSIANVAFTAAGGTGATGGAGPPGGKGDPGNPGAPGPPGENGSNGVSPSPKYVAVTVNYVPTYYTYPNPIPLDNGQTLTLEAYGSCSASYTSGPPGVVAFSLQISTDGGASYSQIAADQTGGMNDGDGQDLDVAGTYTNTSGSRQTITARLFANRNGQAGTSVYGTFQPS